MSKPPRVRALPLSGLLGSLCFGGLLMVACDGTSAVPAGDTDDGETVIPPELTYVETALAPESIGAGQSTLVTCSAKDQYEAPFTPTLAFEFEVVDANDQVPDGVTIDGYRVTAQNAGVVRVRCRYPGTPPISDQSPVSLTIQSGPVATIKTTILRTDLIAGERINVACSGRDALNNATSTATELRVSPSTGTTITDKTIRFTKVGTFEVRCAAPDNTIVGNAVNVTVSPAPLAVLETVLSDDLITPGEEVNVTCPGRDEFGNTVVLDKVITLPVDGVSGLDTDRTRISSTRAGTYPITCAPKESWVTSQRVPATLTVIAGAPTNMTLDLSPDRTIYGLGARPMATPKLSDTWGNPVADVSGISIQVRHNGALQETIAGGQRTTLGAEGTWTLTALSGPPANLSTSRTVLVDASAPTIDIITPTRAQMVVTSSPTVRLRAEIRDATGGLKAVKVNGAARNVTAGQTLYELDIQLSVKHGLNTVTIEATDVQDQTVKVVQGFLASPGYKAATQSFADGLIMHLSRLFIDDGNRTGRPDDLATIFQRVVGSFDVSDYVPSPVVTYAGYDVYLRDISYDEPRVSLTPAKDKLVLGLDVDNLQVDIDADGFIDVDGTVTATSVNVDMDLGLTIVNGQPRVTAQAVLVDIQGMEIDVHWSINWLIGLFSNTIRDSIASSFSNTLKQEIPPAIEEALAGFAVDQTFEVPAFIPGMSPLNVRLQAKPEFLVLNERELDLALGTQVTAATRVPWATSGSMMRGGCFGVDSGLPSWNAAKRLSMGLSTDVLNQILHAVWQGGALEVALPPEMLGDADLSQYGITDLDVDLSARLPPILTDCQGELYIQLGELNIDASLKMGGSPLVVSMVVYFETKADVSVDTTGKISLSLGEIAPEDIVLDITRVESDLFGPQQEDLLIQLLRDQLLTELLSGFAGEGLADFPLPELDLGSLSPTLSGQVISLRDIALGRSRGYVLLEGSP